MFPHVKESEMARRWKWERWALACALGWVLVVGGAPAVAEDKD